MLSKLKTNMTLGKIGFALSLGALLGTKLCWKLFDDFFGVSMGGEDFHPIVVGVANGPFGDEIGITALIHFYLYSALALASAITCAFSLLRDRFRDCVAWSNPVLVRIEVIGLILSYYAFMPFANQHLQVNLAGLWNDFLLAI